jgi:putative endonuclease
MLNKYQKIGQKGEYIAARFLKKKGYKIITKNYHTKLGEIDIIAKDKDTIAFIEVKTRTSEKRGNPKSAVTLKKQQTISKVALHYLKETHQSEAKARFDVVAIQSSANNDAIELIKNAFELAY